MLRKIGWGSAVLVFLILLLAAEEKQWIGFTVSVIRSTLSESASAVHTAAEPDKRLSSGYDQESGTLMLLAAGDIVDCPERSGFAKALPTTADLLGLPSAFDLNDVAASRTARLAAAWPNTPVLALGDLVYNSGTPVEFAKCYDPIWGGLRNRTLPTPGNHEYNSPGAFGYYDYWSDQAGPNRRGYYAAKAGSWLVLSLNSEVAAGPDSDQGRWLQQTLDATPQACILAFYHRPAFSLQERGGRDSAVLLFQQLQRNGATLVLNGHNHFYERTAPLGADGAIDNASGTIAFTVGTGGRTSSNKPALDATDAAVFGSVGLLRLELGEAGFRWWYHDASNGEILDQGKAPCNPSSHRTLSRAELRL